VNIVVCIKQVPDTETVVKIAGNKKAIITDDIKWVINPYDEFGIEEALRIQKRKGGEITAVSIGPKRVVESLRTALAMGVNKAILIENEKIYGEDPLIVAKILAFIIKPLNPHLIFLGQRAVDDDAGLVGSALAEFLNVPNLSVVTKVELHENIVKVLRPIEGQIHTLESSLPVIITTQKGLNEPRYASLPGIMKAKKKPLTIKKMADLGIRYDNKIQVNNLTFPPKRAVGKIINGETIQELAENLTQCLREEAKVI